MSVYFVQRGGPTGPIKIGHARNVPKRIASLQTGCAERLTLLHTVRGGALEESGFHGAFRRHRIGGEWFKPHPDILNHIARLKGEKREPAAVVDPMRFATGFMFFAFGIVDDEEASPELRSAANTLLKLYMAKHNQAGTATT